MNSPYIHFCQNEECGEAFEPPARVPGDCGMSHRIKCRYCPTCRGEEILGYAAASNRTAVDMSAEVRS